MKQSESYSHLMLAAARAAGGVLALATAAMLSSSFWPKGLIAHADGWTMLTGAALLLNGAAAAKYLASGGAPARGEHRLAPLLDALMPFLAACALTIVLTTKMNGYGWLHGVWLIGCGQMHLAVRHVMPRGPRVVGFYYFACGIAMLLFQNNFLNPWPLAAVLFIGETAAAAMLVQESLHGVSRESYA